MPQSGIPRLKMDYWVLSLLMLRHAQAVLWRGQQNEALYAGCHLTECLEFRSYFESVYVDCCAVVQRVGQISNISSAGRDSVNRWKGCEVRVLEYPKQKRCF